jgi:hypothetical protein
LIRLLERDRQDAADLLERCRLPIFEEAEERLDGRQPDVARDGAFFRSSSRCSRKALTTPASSCSNVSADGETFSLFGGEHEEQLEAHGVGVARVPAGAPLAASVSRGTLR